MRFLTLAIINTEKESIWFTDSPMILEVFERSLGKLLERLEGEGKFDAYEVSDVTTAKQLLKHFDELDPNPYRVITPELDLWEQPYNKDEIEDEKLFYEYLQKIRTLLSKYQDHGVAVFITCHH